MAEHLAEFDPFETVILLKSVLSTRFGLTLGVHSQREATAHGIICRLDVGDPEFFDLNDSGCVGS